MARARKSHEGDEETVKSRKGLPAPYGKVGDNIYVVYCDLKRDQDDHARVLVLNFAAKYAAAYFIRKILNNDTWEECDPVGSRDGFITATGIRVTMFNDQVWELVNYEPTDAEASWEDHQIDQHVLQFKYGRGDKREEVIETEEDGDDSSPAPKSIKPAKTDKPAREPKPVKVKPDTSGHVSANDIAKKLKAEGREVRGVLRALNLPKPEHGWSWPKAEADKIEKQIVDTMKKQMAERGQKLGKKK